MAAAAFVVGICGIVVCSFGLFAAALFFSLVAFFRKLDQYRTTTGKVRQCANCGEKIKGFAGAPTVAVHTDTLNRFCDAHNPQPWRMATWPYSK